MSPHVCHTFLPAANYHAGFNPPNDLYEAITVEKLLSIDHCNSILQSQPNFSKLLLGHFLLTSQLLNDFTMPHQSSAMS